MRRLILALACAALLPRLAGAQTGMSLGTAFESGERYYRLGVALGGSFAPRSAGRVGMRFDLGMQAFDPHYKVCSYPCYPQAVPSTSLIVVSSTANLVLAHRPLSESGFYLLAGLGAHWFAATPYNDGTYLKLGWNGGGGVRLGSKLFAEVRYHGLIDPRLTRGFVPITLGFRF